MKWERKEASRRRRKLIGNAKNRQTNTVGVSCWRETLASSKLYGRSRYLHGLGRTGQVTNESN